MIVKTLLAALVAGLIAGVFMTGAQQLRVVPLILHAETYEGGLPAHAEHAEISPLSGLATALSPISPAHAHGAEGDEHEEGGGMLFGMSRFSGTLMANLVAGAGFALLLAGLSLLTGQSLNAENGLVWGALGWLAVHLLPAIGLPPELPGFPAADLAARQGWWLSAVILSGAGLALIGLRRALPARIAGLVLIALPHLWGAPQPADLASPVPAVLGAEFAVAALATTLAFWLVLGLVSGWLNDRVARAA